MIEPIFFEIPIYRCSKKVHGLETEIEEKKWASVDNFHQFSWYAWKYNEIIGYLNLNIFGSQLRIDIWFVDKKRFNRGILKKKFKLHGKVFEKVIPRNKSSNEIFEFIIKNLIEINKSNYKRFHFDLRTFKVVGQFVDWVELTTKLNSFAHPEFWKKYFEDSEL